MRARCSTPFGIPSSACAETRGSAEEVHDALTGHSGGGVGRSYGGGFGLRALAEAIETH